MHPHVHKTSTGPFTAFRIIIAVLMTSVLLAAFLLNIPRINILEHTARNLYFHVPMWFTMMAAALVSGYHSIKVLTSGSVEHDIRARESIRVGVLFGVLGLVTGIVWSRFTWYQGTGKWWNNDPKQLMATTQLLIYGAYFVLRSGIDRPRQRRRIAAVYNLFAFTALPFLLYVLPRMQSSLHPGAEGNPAFDQITHPTMRMVFYPAIIAFIGLFYWLYSQRVRSSLLSESLTEEPLPTK